ncbi:MAG: type 2 isopentenyl-diphosphate Delta-isomerase [Deltaproteobacteria bacterium]|nr:type 2 isopentenyl-diphosphate Delta-isomerase [Deltaproteobacteria bacterium]
MTDVHRSRKDQHLDLCLGADVGFRQRTTLLEEVEVVHDALPDFALESVDPSVTLLGRQLRLPVVISAITGGTERAEAINRRLAAAAQAEGTAFGFGSQRLLLEEGIRTGFEVRDVAPETLILGNIGLAQARRASPEALFEMLEISGADALCLHLNVAQEVVQAEGARDFRAGLQTIQRLVEELGKPLVVKETGCGLSRSVGMRLREAGVTCVDVGGAGGTSWVGVEALRTAGRPARVGETFWDWGIPTAASIAQVHDLGFEIVATGGLANGLDALRALALGAKAVGFARHLLPYAVDPDPDAVRIRIEEIGDEIRMGLLLAGARTPEDLRTQPVVIGPRLLPWVPPGAPLCERRCGAPRG